jgi:hypothetical protein
MSSGELHVANSNNGGERNGRLRGRVDYRPLIPTPPSDRNYIRFFPKALWNEGMWEEMLKRRTVDADREAREGMA